MRIIKIGLLSILTIFALLTVMGAVYQSFSEYNDRKLAPGDLVNVNGHQFHMLCKGTGSPVVILENGLGNSYPSWTQVLNKASNFTKVCSYDRLGLGWSSDSEKALTSADVAYNLHALLIESNIKEPLILVGWSAGGVFIRQFQQTYPDTVKGMVFVDSSHEQQSLRLTDTGPRDDSQTEGWNMVDWTGVLRAFDILKPLVSDSYSPSQAKEVLNIINRTGFSNGVLNEEIGFNKETRSDEPPKNLNNLPLIVIIAGKPDTLDDYPEGTRQEIVDIDDKIWKGLQDELSTLSSNTKFVIATESSHGIPRQQPQIIVDAIKELYDSKLQ